MKLLGFFAQLPLKVYLDSGTDGGEKAQYVLDLCKVLFQPGYTQNENLFELILDGATHEERVDHAFSSRIKISFSLQTFR
jgi:hypothetical protein